MASRLKLHEELCDLLGSRNVYYNPPESLKLQYPGIKYSLSGVDNKHADNINYMNTCRYSIIVLSDDPDCTIYTNILSHFSSCSLDRTYVADKLNHFVLTLYY